MKLNINEIKKYRYVGIRGLSSDEKYDIGHYCRNSFDWDYEKDESTYESNKPIEFNGTCSYSVAPYLDFEEIENDGEIERCIMNAYNAFKNIYLYDDIVIIAGDSMEYGMDDNEIIIENAIVVGIF